MATGSGTKNKKSSGKTSGSKASSAARKNTRMQNYKTTDKTKSEQEKMISTELALLLVLAATVLFFLCNFGIIGPVGNAISGFQFGIFGPLAYIAPIFFFLVIAFGISNWGNFIAILKLSSVIGLFLIVGAFLHIIQGNMAQFQC